MKSIFTLFMFCTFNISSAHANPYDLGSGTFTVVLPNPQSPPQDLSTGGENTRPKYTLGGGPGFIHLLHVDYSRWIKEDLSLGFSLTPLLMLNVATIGVNKHVSLLQKGKMEHNFLVSGGVTGIVGIMDGSPAIGPNGRVGYEWLGERFGFRSYLGGLVIWTSQNDVDFGPDVGFSLLYVKR